MPTEEVVNVTGLFKATPKVVNDYLRLFVNRRAYTLQSMRPHPASGRHITSGRPTRRAERRFRWQKRLSGSTCRAKSRSACTP